MVEKLFYKLESR